MIDRRLIKFAYCSLLIQATRAARGGVTADVTTLADALVSVPIFIDMGTHRNSRPFSTDNENLSYFSFSIVRKKRKS